MPAPRFDQLHRKPGPFFIALGGAGMFGANFYLYGTGGEWIAIDCGFALQSTPGGSNQVSVPSIDALERYDIKLSAILITHGHEDHIGAIPHLWRQLDCPLYASPFAASLIRNKLDPTLRWPTLKEIRPLEPIGIGAFQAEWIPVTHSIPESHAILLEAAGKRLYHSGDWKLDPQPLVGGLTAQGRLQAIGRSGVDVIIGDSTNAPVGGASCSEATVQNGLLDAIRQCRKRVVVTCFASNLARLHSLAEIAFDTTRYAGLLGRSLLTMHSAGRAHNYLSSQPGFIGPWELGYLPREQQLWICTGSQGEPAAALGKLAGGSHPHLTLESGDTVVFSSRLIPGNEVPLAAIKSGLLEQGVEIIDDDMAPIHASGHPPQEDLRQLYGWLRGRYLLPVHGELYHQQAHMQFGRSMGLSGLVPANGDLIDLSAQPCKIADLPSGLVVIDR
ncbi:MAG TPA: ribonuclease J [Pseudomonas xinjiangensis]|uniref:Ribonuclease J n=2 Tax=root TaxID=1 RepID=A0A7V1BRS1_9GAMM|nr:ribonuclease J [Halopseudomonas xinjiangensis]HEC46430.1 ribonuclease J [Halopseudomonas xinjiangensis]